MKSSLYQVKKSLRQALTMVVLVGASGGVLAQTTLLPVRPGAARPDQPRIEQRMTPVKPGSVQPATVLGDITGVIEEHEVGHVNRSVIRQAERNMRQGLPADGRVNFFTTGKRALVLYDSAGDAFWMGKLYGQHVANLLTYFNHSTTLKPVEDYQSGEMFNYDATFYFGIYYNNPTPQSFRNDARITWKPFMWFGYNLWQVAWTPGWDGFDPTFEARYGFRFNYLDGSVPYPHVEYKGERLKKVTFDPVVGVTSVLNPGLAQVRAELVSDSGQRSPYIMKGNNLWYVADNPFAYEDWISNLDRALAVHDSLHDLLGSTPHGTHKAIIRLEDVSPIVPAATLRAIADAFWAERVPYVICVVPEYVDPLGVDNNGVPRTIKMDKARDFINALKYMEQRGGQVIMHGYTHQYRNLLNPYSGISGPDFEFFRVILNEQGEQVLVGPVEEDSFAWNRDRIKKGMELLWKANKWKPTGWVTPHYLASPIGYQVFAETYQYSMCRGLFFAEGRDGKLYYLQQKSPFPYRDTFGMVRLPETIGYVELTGFAQQPPSDEFDLIERARIHKAVVRDSWAGMYFHWFREPSRLRTLLSGVKNLGFQFENPRASLFQPVTTQ